MLHLFKVKGHYYFRMRVPVDMQKVLKKKVIKKSLHTTQLSNAKLILKKYDYQLERLFTLVRCGMISNEDIRDIISKFFHGTLENFEEGRSKGNTIEDESTLKKMIKAYGIMQQQDIESLKFSKLEGIQGWLDGALEDQGISIEKDSYEYRKLCREALKMRIKFWQIEIERLKGNYDNEYDSAEISKIMQHSSQRQQQHTPTNNRNSDKEEVLLSRAIEKFIDVKVGKKENSKQTVEDSMSIFNLLLQVIGDVDIRTINKDAAIKFMSVVNKIPKNMNVMKEFKGKHIDKVLKIVEKKNKEKEGTFKLLSDSSRKKYVERVSMLFKWCVDADYCDKNYFKNLAVKLDDDDKQKRRPYTREDLLRFVQSPIFTDKNLPLERAYQFFIPLIGLFAGMRMNEICQLHTEDIREINGVWCIDVNKNSPDKRLKSKAARRIVPLHPVVIKAGLIEYKKIMEEQGNERMWMELKFKEGNYKEDYSTEFNKYIDKHITDDREVNFHVFRNTLSDNLKQQGISISEAPVAAILGHKHPNITFDTYGQSYNPKPLLEVLMKLDYAKLFDEVRFPFKE